MILRAIEAIFQRAIERLRSRHALYPICFLVAICILLSNNNLTSDSMPSGDAKRIYPYIEFAEHVPERYPTWNPYKLGGVPTLAEAERFLALSQLISANKESSFLQFNTVLIALYIALALLIYTFSRQLAISNVGAISSSIIFLSSQFVFDSLKSGRIEPIMSMSFAFLTFSSFVKYRQKHSVGYLIISMIAAAFIFNSQGYYALILLYLPLIFLGVMARPGKVLSGINETIREIAYISVGGVLLGAVFIVPLLDYSFAIFSNFSPKSTLSDTQPVINSLLNLIYPLSIQKQKDNFVYLYCGFVALPILIIYLSTRKLTPWPYEKVFLYVFLSGFVFTLGHFFPFSLMIEFFSTAPVVKNIRWASSFQFLMILSITLFCGAGIDRLRVFYKISRIKRKSTWFITILIATGLVSELVYNFKALVGDEKPLELFFLSGIKNSPEISIYLIATMLIPFLTNKKILPLFLVACILLPPVLNRPYSEMHRLYDQALPDSYGRVIREDPSYFSVYLKRGRTGMAGIRNINGFSMYFSEEHRRTLDLLYGIKSDAMRPHWVKVPALSRWNPGMVDLLNIKYVEIRKKDYSDLLEPGWAVVAEEFGTVLLKRRDWNSSLRFYEDVEIKSLSEISTLLSAPGADIRRVLFTDAHSSGKALETFSYDPVLRSSKSAESEILITHYSGSRVTLDVTSDQDGFLLFPENWDRYWAANRNGINVPIIRAFGIFRAVAIHAGENHIEMSYRPVSFRWGIVISSAFLVLMIFVFLIRLISSKRKKLNNINLRFPP